MGRAGEDYISGGGVGEVQRDDREGMNPNVREVPDGKQKAKTVPMAVKYILLAIVCVALVFIFRAVLKKIDEKSIEVPIKEKTEAEAGDYILFVDQDDSIDPENISTVVRLLDDNPEVDIVQYSTDVGCDEKRISCDQVYVEGIVSSKEVKNKIIPSMLMCEPCEWVSYTGHLWAIVFRYKFISKNLLTFKYFIDYEDDYLFVFDALCKCNLVYYYKSTGYHWNENLNSYSYNAKSINDYIVRADKRDAYLKEKATGIVDEKLLDSLLIYMTQKTIIDSFLNCCNNGIINHEALNNIILYLKKSNYHSAAYKEKILIRDHRYRFMLYVLRLFRVRVTAVAFKLYGISKQWRQSRDRKSM